MIFDLAERPAQGEKSLFSILPPELRNKIFKYVFEGPEGLVQLKQTSTGPSRYKIRQLPDDTLSLSILQTCAQMYNECNGLLWQYNTLCVPADELLIDYPLVIRKNILSLDYAWSIRKMVLQSDMLGADLCYMKIDFEAMQSCTKLEKLVLTVRDNRHFITLGHFGTALMNQRIYTLSRHYSPLDEDEIPDLCALLGHTFRNLRKPFGPLNHLDRTLAIIANEPAFTDQGWPEVDRLCLKDEGNPNELMKKLASAFGGNFIFNNELLYKDGKFLFKEGSFFMSSIEAGRPDRSVAYYFRSDIYTREIALDYVKAVGGDLGTVVRALAARSNDAPRRKLLCELAKMSGYTRENAIIQHVKDGSLPDLRERKDKDGPKNA